MQHHDRRTRIAAAVPVRQQLQGVPLELHGVVPGHSPFVFETQDLAQAQIRRQGSECRIRALGGNLETPVVSRQELFQHGPSPCSIVVASGQPEFRDQPVLEGSRGTFHRPLAWGDRANIIWIPSSAIARPNWVGVPVDPDPGVCLKTAWRSV